MFVAEGPRVDAVEQTVAAIRAHVGTPDKMRYAASATFVAGQLIEHPKFGEGYVLHVSGARKMEVLFDGGTKVLACALAFGEAVPKHKRRGSRTMPRQPPVTVAAGSEARTSREAGTTSTKPCPKCGRHTHPQNFLYSPAGRIVGCMWCCT